MSIFRAILKSAKSINQDKKSIRNEELRRLCHIRILIEENMWSGSFLSFTVQLKIAKKLASRLLRNQSELPAFSIGFSRTSCSYSQPLMEFCVSVLSWCWLLWTCFEYNGVMHSLETTSRFRHTTKYFHLLPTFYNFTFIETDFLFSNSTGSVLTLLFRQDVFVQR